MSDTSTNFNEEPDRKAKLEEFYFQRRILFGCTISLLIATILWIIAMSTNRWFIVSGGQGKWTDARLTRFKSTSLTQKFWSQDILIIIIFFLVKSVKKFIEQKNISHRFIFSIFWEKLRALEFLIVCLFDFELNLQFYYLRVC